MHTGKTSDNLTAISMNGEGWQAMLIDMDRKFQLLDPEYNFLYVNTVSGNPNKPKQILVDMFDKKSIHHSYSDKYAQKIVNVCSESGVYIEAKESYGCNYRFIDNPAWEGNIVDAPTDNLTFETKEQVNNFFHYYHTMLQPDFFLQNTIYSEAPIIDWVNFTTAINQLGLSPYVENRATIKDDDYFWIPEDDEETIYGNVKNVNFIPTPVFMKIYVNPSYDSLQWTINPGYFHQGASRTVDFTNTFVNYRDTLSSIRSAYLKAFTYAQKSGIPTTACNLGYLLAMTTIATVNTHEDTLESLKNFLSDKLDINEGLLRLLLHQNINSDELFYYKDLPLELIRDLTTTN